jgi:hypothetical protein
MENAKGQPQISTAPLNKTNVIGQNQLEQQNYLSGVGFDRKMAIFMDRREE